MAKDRVHDDGGGPQKPATAPATRTMLVRTPFASSDDSFVPGAATRLQPTPVHTATRVSAFDDSDEETVTNFAAVVPGAVSDADALDDLAVDVDLEGQLAAGDPIAAADHDTASDAEGRVDDDALQHALPLAPVKNPFRDAATQVDLASLPSDEYAISAENGDDDDTDAHLSVLARAEVVNDDDPLAAFVEEIAGEGDVQDISDLPTAAHATPFPDDAEAIDAPAANTPDVAAPSPPGVENSPAPPAQHAVAKTMANITPATPPTELEDEAPVDLARWRVVPTGWDAQPSYYSPTPQAPPSTGAPQKVHTVMWSIDAEGQPEEPAAPSVTSFGDDQVSGRFRDATGANQLASVYITDALRALDDLAVLSQGLEPEPRRAMHAGLFGVAQKLRRAMSLLDAEKPEGNEPG